MDLTYYIKRADDLIQKILDDYGDLFQHKSGKISQVDLDLLLDDLKSAYDIFKRISKINSETPIAVVQQDSSGASKGKKAGDVLDPEPGLFDFTEERAESAPGFEKESEPVSQQEAEPVQEQAILETAIPSAASDEIPDNVADDQEQNQYHFDLKRDININERFTFMSDLFGPSPKDYEIVIDQLNHAGNLEEATRIYDLAKEKYNWGDDYSAKRLYELVCRRYQSDLHE